MKKILPFLFLFALYGLFGQAKPITKSDAQRIADANAKALWGEALSSVEPLIYYGPDDEVIAYHFTYAINKAFPAVSALHAESKAALDKGLREIGWGVNDYGNMVVGANQNMPVIIEYSQCLPAHYALGNKLIEAVEKEFPSGFQHEKTYFYGVASVWHCYTDGKEKKYINLQPKVHILNEDEFTKMTKTRKYFWTDDTFEDEWTSLYDNREVLDRSRARYIPGKEDMPFTEWSFGCVPTSGAMVYAWWDNHYYLGKLVDFYYTRYDPITEETVHHVPSILPILANAMYTGSESGNTDPWDVNDGMEVAGAHQGYTVDCEGSWGLWPSSTFFDEIKDYIQNDTPGLASIDPAWFEYHTCAAVGYTPAPRRVHLHDPNQPAERTVSYSILEADWYVYPESAPQNSVKIISPDGGEGWYNNEGGNELLRSGDFFEINWSSYTQVDSTFVKLYYNPKATRDSDDWILITGNTANDGAYDWQVPTVTTPWGPNTQYARIKIELFNANTGQMLAQDGSYGNFFIADGGGLNALNNAPSTVETDPDYFSANAAESDKWYTIGVTDNNDSSNYWRMKLYNNTSFTNQIEESYQWDETNYIVIDNHYKAPANYGLKFNSIQWESGRTAKAQMVTSTNLTLGSPLSLNWGQGQVVKIFNVSLVQGDYFFSLSMENANADLDIALFYCNGDGIYTLQQAIASSRQLSGNESFIYSCTLAGNYGLVINSRNLVSTNYTLEVGSSGKWIGGISPNWLVAGNWYGGIIPGIYSDVVIPAGCTYYPVLNGGLETPGYVRNITIKLGGLINIADGYLNVYGDMTVQGLIRQNHPNSVIDVTGNVVWETGSTYETNNEYAKIYCYKNWTVKPSADLYMPGGNVIFASSGNSYIEIDADNFRFYNLKLNKSSGASVIFSELSEANLRVTNDLIIYSGSTLRSTSVKRIEISNTMVNNGSFKLDAGTVKFMGDHAYLNCLNGDYFNNLTINTTNNTALLSDLVVKGDLTINSGGLLATIYHLYIGGSWINNIGLTGFNKGTSIVTFNGSGVKDCLNGNFYIMEVNNPTCKLNFSIGTSSCDFYDWTAGGISVSGATLTINDLIDNGIYGAIYVSNGQLDIYQDNAQNVNLSGELHISGGVMNVYSVVANSYWPGSYHAWLDMSGGVLDFHNTSIRIITSTYQFTGTISDGLIRTASNLTCTRLDFAPEGGVFEMYGTGDKILSCVTQSQFPTVHINKALPARDDLPQQARSETSYQENAQDLRSMTVTLNSDITLSGGLIIGSGTLNLNGYQLTTADEVDVNGHLIMTNANDRLIVGTSLNWGGDASGNITAGEIKINRDIVADGDATFSFGTANTVRFIGDRNSILYLPVNSVSFGNIIFDKTAGTVSMDTGTQYLIISNDFTINTGNIFNPNSPTITVSNMFTINGTINITNSCTINTYDITINGSFNMNSGALLVSRNLLEGTSGIMNLTGGIITCTKSYTGNYMSFAGNTFLDGCIIEITNEGVQFGTGSQFDFYSGLLKVGWGFRAPYANTFLQSGGSVMLIGNRGADIEMHTSNYFYNLDISKTSTSYNVYIINNLSINNDLIVNGGNFGLGGRTISVARDVVINGGWLTASNAADVINVGRNWTNNAGVNAFAQGSGTVHFVSSQVGTISTEDFYNLSISKSSSDVNDLFIGSGKSVKVNGYLNILYGCFKLLSGSVLDANGNVSIQGGGGLDITSTETSNTLYLAGYLYDENDTIGDGLGLKANAGSTIYFDGTGNQEFGTDYTELNLYDVYVNKNSGQVKPYCNINVYGNFNLIKGDWNYSASGKTKQFYKDLIIESLGTFSDNTGLSTMVGTGDCNLKILGVASFGSFTINKSRTSQIYLTGNALFNGITTINLTTGKLNTGNNILKYEGSLTVGSTGFLNLSAGSVLNINNNSTFTIAQSGSFSSIGSSSNPAMLTSDTGYYAISIARFAQLAFSHTIFEKMNSSGMNMDMRAYVDTLNLFYHCTFRNSAPGGRLLHIPSNKYWTINGASFPDVTPISQYNVYLSSPLSSVTFMNYSGAFSGADYHYAPNNNIFWVTQATPDTPQNVNINISNGQATITWDPVLGATGYNIYRTLQLGENEDWESIGSTDQTSYGDESIIVYPRAFYLIKAYIE